MNWRLIPYSFFEPAWNMAVDEAIFLSYLKGLVPPTLRFYGWNPPALSVGYFQNVADEVNLINLEKNGFGLVRRNTGGRAVLHHNELTYSVVAGVKDGAPEGLKESYFFIARVLIDALQHLGVNAELHQNALSKNFGTGACFETPSQYELMVDHRKLIGSAQFRQGNSFLQHGSILFDFSAADLEAVLNIGDVPRQSFIELLNTKVTSLRHLGFKLEPEVLAEEITQSFYRVHGVEFVETGLTADELQTTKDLIEEKYGNVNWNLQRGSTGSSRRIQVF